MEKVQRKKVKSLKNFASKCIKMYKKQKQQETAAKEFKLPFGGKLVADNRWVILAQIIPWAEFEGEYAAKLKT